MHYLLVSSVPYMKQDGLPESCEAYKLSPGEFFHSFILSTLCNEKVFGFN